MARTIKNPHHGIRAQMILKLINKLQMVETETDSSIDVQKWKDLFELWCSHSFTNKKI